MAIPVEEKLQVMREEHQLNMQFEKLKHEHRMQELDVELLIAKTQRIETSEFALLKDQKVDNVSVIQKQ